MLRRVGVAPIALLLGAVTPMPVSHGRSLLGLPDLCPFRAVTGLPCPGCGMTRALVCCCHLRFREAVIYHPLGPALFAALVVVSLWHISGLRRAMEPWTDRIAPPVRARIPTLAAAASSALLLLVWMARLAGRLPYPP